MDALRKKSLDYALIIVILVSAFMNLFLLNQAGSNDFYTVAVKSMMKNFHNFFFASFDPAGFITVDKPPVALWLQVLSAKVFGFSHFSVLLPEAIAAVISTALVYGMMKKKAGKLAAFISGSAMATTPIFVAVSRTNNVDSILILTLVLAAWSLLRAEASGKLRWLIGSVILVGIGFNVKMLEAFMILPAIYIFYWIAIKISWKRRLIHLGLATVVLAVVSLSWSVVVDSIPASDRPYVGSSQTNSELELAFGYNGLSRLTGQQGGGGHSGMGGRFGKNAASAQKAFSPKNQGGKVPQEMESRISSMRNRGGAQGSMFGTGSAGPLRLFSKALSGQASWLLPFVLVGMISIAADWIRRRKLTVLYTFAIFWFSWLVPAVIFFSVAGFFHQYYLSLMAPPIAALVGLGASFMIRDFMKQEERLWTSFLLPIALGATLLFEALIFYENNINAVWSELLVLAALLSLFLGLLWRSSEQKRIKGAIAGTGLAIMFLPALYWSLPSVMNQTNSSIPVAGPSSTLSVIGMGGTGAAGNGGLQGFQSESSRNGEMPGEKLEKHFGAMKQPSMQEYSKFQGPSGGTSSQSGQMNSRGSRIDNFTERMSGRQGFGMGEEVNIKLLTYLRKHYQGEKFILAVQRAQSAYSIMLKTNYAVMAMGGFGGSDPALTVSKLEKMVKAGEIKYFLISGGQMGGTSNSSVTNWIKNNCVKVPSSEWSNTAAQEGAGSQTGFGWQNGRDGQSTLYVYKK